MTATAAPPAAHEPRRPETFAHWFERERSEALATILLTSRDDLVLLGDVGGPSHDRFRTVRVRGADGLPAGEFVVHWAGTRKPADLAEPPAIGAEDVERLDPTRPAVRFLFDVVSDDGKYVWLVRPTTGANLRAVSGDAAWSPLDRAALDAIVAEVAAWYDAARRDRLAAA